MNRGESSTELRSYLLWRPTIAVTTMQQLKLFIPGQGMNIQSSIEGYHFTSLEA